MGQKSNKEGQRFIYALIDPRDSSVRYVGCAIDIDKRLKEHLRSKNLSLPKYRWLAELKQQGLSPEVKILDVAETFAIAFNKEEYWIKEMLRSGEPLTNTFIKEDKQPVQPRRKRFRKEPFIKPRMETRLKKIRTALGITQEEVVSRTYIACTTYKAAEGGYPISISVAEDILQAINCLLTEFGRDEVSLADLGLLLIR
jgi:hypothetical protein